MPKISPDLPAALTLLYYRCTRPTIGCRCIAIGRPPSASTGHPASNPENMLRHVHSPRYLAAFAILRTLRDAGHQAYFAGGCVRDLLLGDDPKDFDVATSATPDQV